MCCALYMAWLIGDFAARYLRDVREKAYDDRGFVKPKEVNCMDNAEQLVIEKLQTQIADLDRHANDKKKMVNLLCQMAGQPPLYAETETTSAVSRATKPDEYYGKRLATAIRMVLEKRKASGGGATSAIEIYEELVRGGYDFSEAKNTENAKRGVYAALSKNTTTFHKLPSNTYGLVEWYENIRPSRQKANGANGGSASEKAEADETPLHDELKAEAAETGDDEPMVAATAKSPK